jgi:branched-chain amino acid transport system permease protein
MNASFFLQMLLNGLQLASIYILVALGFTLIFGILHIVNMAQGSVFMLGGYAIWLTFVVLGLNYYVSLLLTILIVAGIGLLFEKTIFRRLQGLVMPTVIVSLALMQVLEQTVTLTFGIKEKIVPSPFPGLLKFWGTVFPTQRLVITLIAIVLTAALVWWVQKSKVGLALRAVAMDRETASIYGINSTKYGALAFALGFGLAGAAGGLIAPLYYVDPMMGAQPLLKMFTVIVVGGLGSLPGTILAGIILGLIDSFVATLFNSVVAAMVGFAMIIGVLLIRPTGLLGHE